VTDLIRWKSNTSKHYMTILSCRVESRPAVYRPIHTIRHGTTRQNILVRFPHARIHTSRSPTGSDTDRQRECRLDWKMSTRAYQCHLMMGTEIVPETSCFLSILTRLIAREDFTTSCRRKSFKSHIKNILSVCACRCVSLLVL
jgi:hypothetical protein